MPNALQLNESTPIVGLGTQEYTFTATGLYTVEFKIFLPYLASGSQPQSTVPSAEVSDVTAVADSSGSLNNKYWTFNSAGDLYQYYVWYNINAAGTDPAVAGKTGIEVAAATDTTAANIALATRTAIAASTAASYVTVSGATTHVILTNKQMGQCTNAANAAGGSSAGFSYSITQGSYGVPAISGLNVVVENNNVVILRSGFPSPTQAILGSAVTFTGTSGQTLEVILTSLSDADSALNAVKGIINLYQGS